MPDSIPRSSRPSLLADPSIRSALFSFTVTRLLILFVVLLSANMRLDPPTRDSFGEIHETNISVTNHSVTDILTRVTSAADSLWILNIASNGYEKEPFNTATQHTWAYFPLYPIILRTVSFVTGNLPLTGIFLSSLFFLLALVYLYRLVVAFDYEPTVADRTVFYLASFPVSYFFSLTQTESLFLFLSVCCFYAARRQRWWLAGVCGGLASATRFAGVFLVLPLAIMYWQRLEPGSRSSRKEFGTDGLSLLLVPLGLILYMLYLKSITGNALAFADIQVAWGHQLGLFARPLLSYVRHPFQVSAGWDFKLLNFCAALTALVAGVLLWCKRAWPFAVYIFVSMLVPLSYQYSLQSIARYVMVLFPVFMVLAISGSRPRVDQVIRVVFIALLSLMSALLALRVTLALS